MKRCPCGHWPSCTAVIILLAVLASVVGTQAANWEPTKPIRFVVPYAPGGGSDVLGRFIVSAIDSGELCPVTMMVENKPGGGGTLGTTSVALTKGDPHLLLTFVSGQVAAPMAAGKGTATFRDLTLICGLAIDEQLIVVKNGSPLKTVQDIVHTAKQRALTIGGTATAQEDQMCNRLFEKAAGIKIRYVPFKSGGECVTAVLGGHVDMIWANPGEFIPQWEAKNVRPIVVAKETRLAMLPEVPTFKEEGYHVIFKMFRGIAAPPGIPAETAAYYENMMRKMSELPSWKEKYIKNYMLTPLWMGREEFAQFVSQSERLFKDILGELGLIN